MTAESEGLLRAAELSGPPKPCLLLVGPEGDFTEHEMKQLKEVGALPVGLGPNRLRVETAAMAIVAGSVLHYESIKHRTEQDAQKQQLTA